MFSKKKLISMLALVLFLFGWWIPTTVSADESDLAYTIAVKPVESQVDKSATYYDLMVTPNQKETLTVVVSNTGDTPKKIRVTPTNAITNQNGVIDYSPQKKDYQYDASLTVPFTGMVGKEQIVEVNPGESKDVPFELTVPEAPFNGLILGAFVAEIADDDEKQAEQDSGVKIVNKFQLVKAVMLRETEEVVSPELVLNEVKPALVSYRTAVTANLQNTEPTMFGKMTVDAKITKKGQTEVLKQETKENLEMAPNSNFDFPIMWGNQRLEAGNYTLALTATAGEKNWDFTQDFTITAEESDKINSEAVDLDDPEPFNWWYVVIGAVLVIIVLLLLFLLLKKNQQSKKDATKKRKSKRPTTSPDRSKKKRTKKN